MAEAKICRGQIINQVAKFDCKADSAAQQQQPRARGAAFLRVSAGLDGQTGLADLRQSGSLKLVFPRSYRPGAEAIIVNTAGGITGGDRFSLRAEIGHGASLCLTTQAAERAYRAQPHEVGRLETHARLCTGARLNWLPQEMIIFDHAALHRRLEVDMADDSSLLLVEPLVFGRAAMRERLNNINFKDRIVVRRNARPIFVDGIDLAADASAHLARAATGAGAGAMASLVFVDTKAAGQLAHIRSLLPATAGASMIAADILVLRMLAADSFELRCNLVPILDHLTQNSLPVSWRL